MKAAVFEAAGRPLVIADIPDPEPGETGLVMQVKCCGICGTDLHFSQVPGGLPAGCVMGHEFSGEVVEVGRGAGRDFSVGDAITSLPSVGCGVCAPCLSGDSMQCAVSVTHGLGEEPGGFAEFVRVGRNEALHLPEVIDRRLGGLVEPLAVGLHAVKVARVRAGQNVLVLGGGPIGLAVVLWLRFLGARSIVVSEPVGARRSLAKTLGATAILKGGPGVAEEFAEHTGGKPDLIFECVGLPGLVAQCIELARPRSKVVVAGVCMAPDTFAPVAAVIKELTLHFVLAYHKDDFAFTIDMMAAGRIDPAPMVTNRIGLSGLPEVFEALRQPTSECKVLLEF